jgi:excisionase family DNA binding protein
MAKALKTEKEICEALKLSRSTIANLRSKGMPFIQAGKSIRYNEDEVIDWLRHQSIQTTGDTNDE